MGQELHSQAQELERVEIVKGVVAIDHGGKVSVKDYVDELIAEGITTQEDIYVCELLFI